MPHVKHYFNNLNAWNHNIDFIAHTKLANLKEYNTTNILGLLQYMSGGQALISNEMELLNE